MMHRLSTPRTAPGLRRLALAAVAASCLSLGAPALAQQPQPVEQAQAAEAPAPARDLSRYKEEPVPGGALLVVAYGVMWLLVGGFVGRLLLRQAKLEAEVQALQERVEAVSDAVPTSPASGAGARP